MSSFRTIAKNLSQNAKRRRLLWICVAAFTSIISAAALLAAEVFPSERTSAVVFVGQVLSNQLVASITNVVNAEHGLYSVDELNVARIGVESVMKHDEPIPRRFPDEVSIYYYWNKWQQCPRPARLASWQRHRFYCVRGNVPGRTNVIILPAASHATEPYTP